MRILYIDPILGVSGDMMTSALIDAGFPFGEIERILKSLPLTLPSISPVVKEQNAIRGIHLKIQESDIHLSSIEMRSLIDGLSENRRIKEDAHAMLGIMVEAESKVHAVDRDSVHLHELSSIDTLIDIVSAAAGINYLGIEKVYSGPVPCGRGTIKTTHGTMPNPAPATVEILRGMKIVFRDIPLELTTPTGATIVRHYAKEQGVPPPMKIEKVGYGFGSYTKTDEPDVVRVFIGNTDSPVGDQGDEKVCVIEVDLDDMEMEYLGACADRMRREGALDVLCFPVYMKKGRLGVRLSVTVAEDRLNRMIDLVFTETTTFGMRIRREERRVLKREIKIAETSFGPVRVKHGYDREGRLVRRHIEFDDIRKVADEKAIPYRIVLEGLKKEV